MAFSGWASEYYKNPLKTNNDDEVAMKDSSKPSSSTSSMSTPKSSTVQRDAATTNVKQRAKIARSAAINRRIKKLNPEDLKNIQSK